jgi:hypothetical protein
MEAPEEEDLTMRCRSRALLAAGLLICVCVSPARAGMASPLPIEVRRMLLLNESAEFRLQAISFFLAVFLSCALIVKWLWNFLQRDFPRLPRLTFAKALVGVFLWGLVFVLVLSMIAGARELMTPGAWKRHGVTYKLAGEADRNRAELRHSQMDKLRAALWHYAAKHNGKFPLRLKDAISPELRQVPESGGVNYVYCTNMSVDMPASVLAYEPEIEGDERWVLLTNGEIVVLPTSEINRRLGQEKMP